jgi:signal transduction histidine kinase
MLFKTYAVTISIVSWLLSFAAYQYFKVEMNLPVQWFSHLIILFVIGFINSAALYLIKKKNLTLLLFIVKVMLLAFICYPLGNFTFIKAILITGIIAESVFYFEFWTNLCLSSMILSFILFISRKRILVWDVYTVPSEWIFLFIFLLYSVFIYIAFNMIKLYHLKKNECKKEIKRQDLMISVLEETNKRYLENAIYSGEKSKVEERKRIARDLHDIIGYSMTNIKMMVEAAITMAPKRNKNLLNLLQDIKVQTNEGFDEIINTVRSMYRAPQNKRTGLASIQSLVSSFINATKINVRVEFANMPNSCGESLDYIIYHIVQEGIINSFKHGMADDIRIYFWKDPGYIKIYIWDNGKSSESKENDNSDHGIGIEGIRDRIIDIGGTFHACNVTNGYEIKAMLPFKGEIKNEN